MTPNTSREFARKRAILARGIAAILVGGSMLAASTSSAHAADAAWTGVTSGAWLTTTNWSPAAAPGDATVNSLNADIATFSAAPNATIGINYTTTLGSYALGALDNTNPTTRTINNSTVTPGVLTLNGATVNAITNTIVRNATGSNFTITNGAGAGTMGLRLGNTDNVIQITGTGGVTINSLISEKNAGSGLTLQGGGTGLLALSGANTYTGVTNVNTGTLEIRNASALGTAAGNTVVAAGARVFAGASFTGLTTAEPFNIAGFGASSGAIHVGGSATGVGFTGAITLGGNATIQGDGNTGTTFSGGIGLGANTLTFGVGANANTTISTTGISGPGSVVKNSSTGTLNFNVANTYGGTTTIDGGVLSLGHVNALGGTSGITISGGATVTTQLNGMVLSAPITLGLPATTSTLSFSRNLAETGMLTLNGAIGGAGDIVFTTPNVSSSGYVQTVLLGAASNYTGNTIITTANVNNSVTVKSGAVNSLPAATLLILNGGNGTGVGGRTVAFDLAGFDQTIAGLSNNTGLLLRNQRILNSTGTAATLEITGNSVFSGEINGTNLNLTKSGTGTFAISGSNGYNGSTKITGGILSLDSSLAMQNSALDTLNSIVGDASNGLQTTVTTLTMGGLTGNKNLADVFTTVAGGYSGLTALTLNPGTGATPSYSGSIADGAAGMTLTKTGAGMQTLAGANAFTGATTISAGTLKLDYGTQNNSKLSDSAALVLGGGTLDLSGGTHTEVVASTTLAAGTASSVTSTSPGAILEMNVITRNAGATINFGASNIATTDTLNVNGILGTWATINGTDYAANSTNGLNGLIAAATYTDVTRLNGGTQVIADGASTNVRIIEGTGAPANITLGAATTTINSLNQSTVGGTSAATIDPAGQTLRTDGILVATGAGGLTIGTGVNNGSLSTATAGGELQLSTNSVNGLTINSVVADNAASSLMKSGSGAATLTGVNTYAGATQIVAGILNANSTDALGNSSATNTLVFTGGTLQAGGTITSAATRSVTLTNTGLFDTNGNAISIAGVMSGTGGVTKSGLGNLTLSGVNTYAGETTISAGTLNANSTDALGDSSATNTLVFAGGTLQAGGTITSANTRQVTLLNTGLIDTNGNDISIAGNISGAAGLTKSGLGTLTLTGANSYTGATTIGAGILNANATNALGDSGASNTLIFTGGTLQAGGAIASAATRLVTLTSTGIIDTNGNPVSIAGVMSGPGGLTKEGADTLTLSAVNTYFGTTTVNAGTLALAGGNHRLATTGAITVNGGTLDLGANSQSTSGIVSFLSGTTTNGTLVKSGADYDGQGGDVSAVLAGAVGMTKTSVGTLSLSGLNTYSGATTINAGILNANSTDALGSANNTLVFTGGTLQAGGTITSPSTRLVTLTSTGLFDTNGNAISIAGVISGANGVTKSGAGTLTLTGVNTYSGATTFAAGTLNANTTDALGDSSASNTLVFTGGTLQAGGTFTSAATRLVTLTNTGLINTNTFNVGIAGVMSGPGGLTKSGTGTLTLTAVNPYAGATSITGGVLNANSTNALGDSSATNTLIFNGGTLQAGGAITSASTRLVTMTGAGTIDTNGNPISIAGIISGGGALTKTGTGTLTLTAANTYTGLTTVSAGTLLLSGGNNRLAVTGAITVNGGTLDLGGNSQTTSGVVTFTTGTTSNGTITKSGAAYAGQGGTVSAILAGAVGLTKTVAGTLTLTGVNTYTGATTINVGTLNANSSSALGSGAASNTLIFTGGTLQAGGTITSPSTRLVTLTNTGLIDTNNNSISIAGIMSGAGGVTKSGLGTLTLSGVNTYSGATTIGAGTLIANATTGLGNSSATNTLIFTGGTLQAGGNITSVAARLVTLTSTGLINTNGFNVSIAGIMSGAGGVTKSGLGNLTLSGVNTYSGATTIGAGTLIANATTGLGNSSATNTLVFTGGTLQAGGAITSVATRLVTLTSTGVIDTNGNAVSIAGVMSGAGGLTKNGLGTLTLTGVNTYSGPTTISAGLLNANSSSALGNSSATNTLIFTGGTLQAGGAITSAATRLVTLTSTGLIDTNSNNVMIAGIMSGPGGLTKSGLGNLTLTGANLYAGVTNVNAGTLFVNNISGSGTGTGAVVVGAAGTLGGSGFISGDVTGSGTVAPGNSVGPLTVTGNYNVTGTHQFEINDVLNSFDEVVGINALTYAGTLNVTNLGAGSGYFAGQQFDLFDFTSKSGTFSTINLPSSPGLVWKDFGGTPFDYTNGLIEVAAIPEPSTWALLGTLTIGLFGWAVKAKRVPC